MNGIRTPRCHRCLTELEEADCQFYELIGPRGTLAAREWTCFDCARALRQMHFTLSPASEPVHSSATHPHLADVGGLVVARTTTGALVGAGRVQSYCEAPTVSVIRPDGSVFHWRADLCTVLDIEAEIADILLPREVKQ